MGVSTIHFSLEKRRLQGDHVAAFQYLKGAYKKYRDNLFSRACCDMTRCNGFKLKKGRFRLGRRKKFFTMRALNTGTGYPERWWMPGAWKHSRPGWTGL